MADIASIVNNIADSAMYNSTAKSYYAQWSTLTIDPSNTHTLLAYEWRSSWGLLYNIFPAKLFNLSIIPPSLHDIQSAFYPTVSQIFGVPLDNRHPYTESDWKMWWWRRVSQLREGFSWTRWRAGLTARARIRR
jgi:Domain of unknown function (DUF1793)